MTFRANGGIGKPPEIDYLNLSSAKLECLGYVVEPNKDSIHVFLFRDELCYLRSSQVYSMIKDGGFKQQSNFDRQLFIGA